MSKPLEMASVAEGDRYPENYTNLLPADTLSLEFKSGAGGIREHVQSPLCTKYTKYNKRCE